MKKIIFLAVMISIILLASLTFAHGNFNETKNLIDSNVSCKELSNEQLEEIGDYYMEQMHPGESHEIMHQMMGGEESETTKLMHINMAKMMYCDEGQGMSNMMNMMSSGMMNGMMGQGNMMGSGMMGSGMMGNYYYQTPQNNSIYQNNFLEFQIFFYIILTLLIIVLILATTLLINKSKNSSKQKEGNNKK